MQMQIFVTGAANDPNVEELCRELERRKWRAHRGALGAADTGMRNRDVIDHFYHDPAASRTMCEEIGAVTRSMAAVLVFPGDNHSFLMAGMAAGAGKPLALYVPKNVRIGRPHPAYLLAVGLFRSLDHLVHCLNEIEMSIGKLTKVAE